MKKRPATRNAPPAIEFAEPEEVVDDQRLRFTTSCSISSAVVIMRAFAE